MIEAIKVKLATPNPEYLILVISEISSFSWQHEASQTELEPTLWITSKNGARYQIETESASAVALWMMNHVSIEPLF